MLYSDENPEKALFNTVFLVKYWLNNGQFSEMRTHMKRLMKQLAAGVLSLTLLLSGTGCTWGQPEDTTADAAEHIQTAETTLPPGSNCYTYRDWVDAMPVNWNPQEWTGEAEAEILMCRHGSTAAKWRLLQMVTLLIQTEIFM